MLNILLLSGGALLQIISLAICFKTNKLVRDTFTNTIIKPFSFIILFVVFFIIGYLTILFKELRSYPNSSFADPIISIIFFFGALFVIITLFINKHLVTKIISHSNELVQKNKILTNQKNELDASKQKYIYKNKELEQTLEDFYLLRTKVAEDLNTKKFEAENTKIKQKIDELKKL